MATANILRFVDVYERHGRCPWRIDYQADDLQVSAYLRLPPTVNSSVDSKDIALVGLPILCDLSAMVRPRKVVVESQCAVPPCRRIYKAAVAPLLAEHDAFWNRPKWTPTPILTGRFLQHVRSRKALRRDTVVLGFSGGKDSIVSLFALLETGYKVTPLLLNQGDRSWQDLRRWIPKLRRLGLEPLECYLTVRPISCLVHRYGDWYYSSYQIGLLAAILCLCAQAVGAGTIAMGVESSADKVYQRYRAKRINHQDQKTTRHLVALERFYRRVLNDRLRIASPIAELSDSEILRVLCERIPRAFQAFSSCGAANSYSKHCCKCEKCAFVYALLAATEGGRDLSTRIFRSDLLQDVELFRPWLDARFRPPLGCIGPRSELWQSLEQLVRMGDDRLVVQAWRNSSIRRSYHDLIAFRCDRPDAEHRLTRPVRRASKQLRKWIE